MRKRYESESDLSLGDYDGLLEEYPGDALGARWRRQRTQVRPVVNIICETTTDSSYLGVVSSCPECKYTQAVSNVSIVQRCDMFEVYATRLDTLTLNGYHFALVRPFDVGFAALCFTKRDFQFYVQHLAYL